MCVRGGPYKFCSTCMVYYSEHKQSPHQQCTSEKANDDDLQCMESDMTSMPTMANDDLAVSTSDSQKNTTTDYSRDIKFANIDPEHQTKEKICSMPDSLCTSSSKFTKFVLLRYSILSVWSYFSPLMYWGESVGPFFIIL